MLRASCSHLPPIAAAAASPTLFVFTSTLHKLSSSTISSSSSSSIALPNPYIINPLFINSPQSLHFSNFKRLSLFSSSNMASSLHHCRNATASFSTGSSSEAGKEILVQHLLVKEGDLQLLVDLQKRASEGEDLSDLAVEYSICPSKEEGGMLGWVRKGQMVPEFEEASFSAPLNKVVRCKTKFGWHLLQVLSQREEPMLKDIQPNELHVKMQDPSFMEEAQLIDVREPEEVDKASLPGFHVLPLRQFGNWGPEIATKFDPSKDTYVLCHHGMRSLQVAKWLQTQGFRKVFNIAGGIHEYAVSVDPSIPTY